MSRFLFAICIALGVCASQAQAQVDPENACDKPGFPACTPTPTPTPGPPPPPANPLPLGMDGCELHSKKDKKTSGRFIWKPRAEHFNQALVVAPRHFYPSVPRVEIWDYFGHRIERMRLKSDGRCAGHPECLFASTHLGRKRGIVYERKYGSILVKILNPRKPSLGCWFFEIDNPGRRAEYR